jgi:hypothetical protein
MRKSIFDNNRNSYFYSEFDNNPDNLYFYEFDKVYEFQRYFPECNITNIIKTLKKIKKLNK